MKRINGSTYQPLVGPFFLFQVTVWLAKIPFMPRAGDFILPAP